jgi:hypothetical protein
VRCGCVEEVPVERLAECRVALTPKAMAGSKASSVWAALLKPTDRGAGPFRVAAWAMTVRIRW